MMASPHVYMLRSRLKPGDLVRLSVEHSGRWGSASQFWFRDTDQDIGVFLGWEIPGWIQNTDLSYEKHEIGWDYNDQDPSEVLQDEILANEQQNELLNQFAEARVLVMGEKRLVSPEDIDLFEADNDDDSNSMCTIS